MGAHPRNGRSLRETDPGAEGLKRNMHADRASRLRRWLLPRLNQQLREAIPEHPTAQGADGGRLPDLST